MKLHSAPEKNEIVTLAGIWNQLDIIVLRKINQSKVASCFSHRRILDINFVCACAHVRVCSHICMRLRMGLNLGASN